MVVSSYPHADEYSLNTQRASAKKLQRSFSILFTSSQYPILWTVAALVSSDSQICLLSSRSPLGSAKVPSLCTTVLELSQGNQMEQLYNFLIYLSTLRDHYPSLPDVQYLKNYCFPYFVRFLVVLNWNVHLVPIIQSWWEAKEFLFNIILINFNLDSHIWLVALILDSTVNNCCFYQDWFFKMQM